MPAFRSGSLPAAILAVLTAMTAMLLFSSASQRRPAPISEVAAAISVAGPTEVDARRSEPSVSVSSDPSAGPDGSAADRGSPSTPEPATPRSQPQTGLAAGSVNRTSLDLVATYHVNAAITVGTGLLDASTTLVVRNAGSRSIDRL